MDKQVNKKKIKIVLNIVNFFLFSATGAIGLLIQKNYHMGRMEPSIEVLGMDRPEWNIVHVVVSVLSLIGLIYHLVLNKKSVKHIFLPKGKKITSKFRMSRIITIVAVITAATGLAAFVFRLAGLMETRMGLMEIHDKLGVIISILFTIHFAQHFRQLTASFSKKAAEPDRVSAN